jgi:hypothetical protein
VPYNFGLFDEQNNYIADLGIFSFTDEDDTLVECVAEVGGTAIGNAPQLVLRFAGGVPGAAAAGDTEAADIYETALKDLADEHGRAVQAEAGVAAEAGGNLAAHDADAAAHGGIRGELAGHLADTANPHGVTLQQAATAQGTNDTAIPGRIFHGGISEGNKYLTAAEIASMYAGGVKYKGKLKYGAMAVADMNGIDAAADNHGLADGDMCGVQATQLSYRYTVTFATLPDNIVPGFDGIDGTGYAFSGLHGDGYAFDVVNGELANLVCTNPADEEGTEHYEIRAAGLSGASFDAVTSRATSWDAQPQGQDEIGDMYLIEYWYGSHDGQTYAGEVQAQIICREITPDAVFDLFLDLTILLDGSVTDEKIGPRTLADEPEDGTLDASSPRSLTGWLQKIYNHLKALFFAAGDAYAHLANGAVHVTAAQKTMWTGKLDSTIDTLADNPADPSLFIITPEPYARKIQLIRNNLKALLSYFTGGAANIANGGTGKTTALEAWNALKPAAFGDKYMNYTAGDAAYYQISVTGSGATSNGLVA